MKRKMYICNAFSLSMLDREAQRAGTTARVPRPIRDPIGLLANAEERGVEIVSAVGHADTAAVFSALLGRPVEHNRVSVKLAHGDELLVGQLVGPRLPEGATSLPEGAQIEWWEV